jgi:hypothetical protein
MSKVTTNESKLLTNLETNQTYLGPIILHSQDTNMIQAIEEYFEEKCIARIRSDLHNFYIDFKPMVKSDKLLDFVSADFVLRHNGEIVRFTHQFYDL